MTEKPWNEQWITPEYVLAAADLLSTKSGWVARQWLSFIMERDCYYGWLQSAKSHL